MKEIIELFSQQDISVNYLHYDVVFPIEKDKTAEFFQSRKNIHLIEGNMTGQLGKLIEQQGHKFDGKLLRYDGRGFSIEQVVQYINDNT